MGPLHYKRRWMQPTARHGDLKKQTARAERKKRQCHPRWDSNPQSSAPETDALSIWPLGQHCWITSSGTRTHNLTLRRGAPYPLGHGGIKNLAAHTAQHCIVYLISKNKKHMPGVGFEPTRTNAQQILSLPLRPLGHPGKEYSASSSERAKSVRGAVGFQVPKIKKYPWRDLNPQSSDS